MNKAASERASPLDAAVEERALSPCDDPLLEAAVRRLVAAAGEALCGLVFFLYGRAISRALLFPKAVQQPASFALQ